MKSFLKKKKKITQNWPKSVSTEKVFTYLFTKDKTQINSEIPHLKIPLIHTCHVAESLDGTSGPTAQA